MPPGILMSVRTTSGFSAASRLKASTPHVAHEVRTPLSSIKMNLQLLEREADAGVVPADVRVNIDTSLREIARLEETVTRFLNIVAPETGHRCHCSLHALLSESVELVGGAMEREGIALRLDLAAEFDEIWATTDGSKASS